MNYLRKKNINIKTIKCPIQIFIMWWIELYYSETLALNDNNQKPQ